MATNCTATAAVKLMFHHPFWCELFYSLKVIETEEVSTLRTDGVRLWVNPAFWSTLALEHKIAALAHEVAHKMLHHCTRGLDFDPYWGNIAADIVVNTLLHENSFSIHKDWVQPEAWARGMTFEAVYHELMKKLQKPEQPQPQPEGQGGGEQGEDEADSQPGGGDDGEEDGGDNPNGAPDDEAEGDEGQPGPDGQPGEGGGKLGKGKPGGGKGKGKEDKDKPADFGDEVPDMPQWAPEQWAKLIRDVEKLEASPEARERFEQQVEQQVANAIATAKSIGNAPAGVEMAMDAVREVKKEAWYDHLARFMQSLSMSEFNWERFDRRQAVLFDMVAPDVYAPTINHVVILLDASGSCYMPATQANFFGHINAIMAEAKPKRITVMFFDTRVHKTIDVDPGEIAFNEKPVGGGGTSFIEPLTRADEEQPDVIICLTDMYGSFPSTPPVAPVVWASTTPGVIAPFGDTILVQ